jgi:NADPH:quinone reductase-like Zn-dependent oxidoreductase
MTQQKMQAVQQQTFGAPEVLHLVIVPVPQPGPEEVLMRVQGCSLNAADAALRAGKLKLMNGSKFPKGAGLDGAGEIAALGSRVTGWNLGDKIWGIVGPFPGVTGTAAEYVVIKVANISAAPRSIEPVLAAALPAVGLTALQALRALGVQKGHRLLIIGASGGVGSTAMQLGVALGARVCAVASASNAEFCRGLGAEEVFDYETTDFANFSAKFDVILDCNGIGLSTYRRLLVRGGKFGTLTLKGFAKIPAWLLTPGPRMRAIVVKPNSADLRTLAQYIDAGQLKPIIEKEYPLQDIVAAHRALDTGHARGKRVLRVMQ